MLAAMSKPDPTLSWMNAFRTWHKAWKSFVGFPSLVTLNPNACNSPAKNETAIAAEEPRPVFKQGLTGTLRSGCSLNLSGK